MIMIEQEHISTFKVVVLKLWKTRSPLKIPALSLQASLRWSYMCCRQKITPWLEMTGERVREATANLNQMSDSSPGITALWVMAFIALMPWSLGQPGCSIRMIIWQWLWMWCRWCRGCICIAKIFFCIKWHAMNCNQGLWLGYKWSGCLFIQATKFHPFIIRVKLTWARWPNQMLTS